MRMREWLEPPRRLLIMFFAVTTTSAAALGWSTWQLVQQDRALGVQRAQERRDSVAALAVARLQQRFADLEQGLTTLSGSSAADLPRRASDYGRDLPSASVLLVVQATGVETYPAGRLLYHPTLPPADDPAAGLFADAEALEFQQPDSTRAIAALIPLTASVNPTVRAHALLRLARNLRKAGRRQDAITTYAELKQIVEARINGIPADLVARGALCDLREADGHREDLLREARTLQTDLNAGRWRLLRPVYDAYLAGTTRVLGPSELATTDAGSEALSEAALWLWDRWQANERAPGRHAVWTLNQSVLIVSRPAPGGLVAFAALPGYVESHWLRDGVLPGAAAPAPIALTDAEGHAVVGLVNPTTHPHAVRLSPATGLPWTLYAVSSGAPPDSPFTRHGQLVLAGLSAIGLLVVGGSYLIGRAVLRELRVARLQSDFVAAVSHEFRTPLTALCQLSELLVDGRATSDDLRRQYYAVLQHESSRLRRLVEGLLKFGRMEAGAMRYQFETLDAATLLHTVIDEFRREADRRGSRVEMRIECVHRGLRADKEALSCAIWNLLDNAVKYSPDGATVWIELTDRPSGVAIGVRDRGTGITPADQQRIFQKFVRGNAAMALGVPGSGIGLAVARHIVLTHGGDITVESTQGEGTTFTIVLPAPEPSDASAPASASAVRAGHGG